MILPLHPVFRKEGVQSWMITPVGEGDRMCSTSGIQGVSMGFVGNNADVSCEDLFPDRDD
jgi:hypothetical protein